MLQPRALSTDLPEAAVPPPDHPPAPLPEPDPADEVVYAISHDLQGPLVNVRGFVGRLRQGCAALRTLAGEGSFDPEQRAAWERTLEDRVLRSAEIIDHNAQVLQRRLDALLELSRTGASPVRLERVAAGELIRQVCQEFQDAATAKGAVLTAGPAPAVLADPDRLAAVLHELVANAVAFLPPGRPGDISLGGDAELGCLWVRDNGIGLRAEDAGRIFQPFGRVREIDTAGEGTGLARVRKLIRQQSGRVWVEAVHGAGCTFYLALPPWP